MVSLEILTARSDKVTLAVDSPTLIIAGIVIPNTGMSRTEIVVVSFTVSSSPSGFIFGTALK